MLTKITPHTISPKLFKQKKNKQFHGYFHIEGYNKFTCKHDQQKSLVELKRSKREGKGGKGSTILPLFDFTS